MIKTLNKLGTEGNYLNIIKAIYEKPTANTIPKDERLKDARFFLPLLFNTVLDVLVGAIRQEEIKGIQTRKKYIFFHR